VLECAKYKGDTHFIESRYFPAGDGAICVQLNLFDWPGKQRTLKQLLKHLRSHYGMYEGIGDQVAEIASAKG
jgi:hypothetical protein